ncbi:hypothetical protein B9Z55_017650 [Caenorhabditis nigoni]|nr:hypothetical protein B9Z55_017650 [Caenorhabditis nigoni]
MCHNFHPYICCKSFDSTKDLSTLLGCVGWLGVRAHVESIAIFGHANLAEAFGKADVCRSGSLINFMTLATPENVSCFISKFKKTYFSHVLQCGSALVDFFFRC